MTTTHRKGPSFRVVVYQGDTLAESWAAHSRLEAEGIGHFRRQINPTARIEIIEAKPPQSPEPDQ